MLFVWVVSNEGFVDNGSHVSYVRGLPEEVDNGSFFSFSFFSEGKRKEILDLCDSLHVCLY